MCIIFAILEVVIIILYKRVIILVKQHLSKFNIHAHTHSLQQRYALNENERITKTLLPSVYCHAIVWICMNLADVSTLFCLYQPFSDRLRNL